MKNNGLGKEDACERTKWRGVVKTMTIRNSANSADGDNPDSTCDDDAYAAKVGLNLKPLTSCH